MEWNPREEQPLTWKETATSVIRSDVRILHVVGVWAMPVTKLYRAYTATIFALAAGYSVEAVMNIWYVRRNMDVLTLSLSAYVVIVTSTFKLLFFLQRERGYWRLVRWLDAVVADQRRFCEERPPLQAVLEEASKRARRYPNALRIYNTSLILVWVFMPLLAPPGQRPLPFQQIAVSDADDFPLYLFSYLLQTFGMLYMTFVSGFLDSFFTAVMIHVAAQFRILGLRFAAVGQDDGERKPQGKSDVDEKPSKDAATDPVYEDLRLCIQTHQEITRFVAHLESVMNPIAALQLISGVINGCLMIFPTAAVIAASPEEERLLVRLARGACSIVSCCPCAEEGKRAFYLTRGPSGFGNSVPDETLQSSESGALLKCVGCVPTISAQVLIYCLGAHAVMEQSEALSEAAYGSAWVATSSRVRRSLLVVMARAMKPLTLTAGGIYTIERATFLSLLNAGYSYYALLKNFNSRE